MGEESDLKNRGSDVGSDDRDPLLNYMSKYIYSVSQANPFKQSGWIHDSFLISLL